MSSEDAVGIFIGLESSSYEYIAYLIAPYRPDFAIEIGDLLLIRGAGEHIVVRVMDYVPRGEFMTSMGEKWLNEITSQGEIDAIGQDIKRSKISYRVRVKVLGSASGTGFSPGLRRIPQITSKVSRPSDREFEEIISSAVEGRDSDVHIGYHAIDESVAIRFDQANLNSKRTFIFARAGYGKSNLMKIICREWKRDNGGLLVFDPEGEYAVTDKSGRPGIMDARGALLLTNQKMDDRLHNVLCNIRLDLRRVSHKISLPVMVPPEKHELVFFGKLMGMDERAWSSLVDLLHEHGWNTPPARIDDIITGKARDSDDGSGGVVTQAIINNLVPAIHRLHHQGADTVEIVKRALRRGEVVIFDISRTDSRTARDTSSIIVKSVFEENKANFIRQGGDNLIRATFVFEEAHTVLSESDRNAPSAFVELAKEGRKYALGGIFITQQPGSVPTEILSQGDNFFVFHLLSKSDLGSLSSANAHYSNDIVTQILNEPIRGKSYMWTSHQPFVIPIMVRNFEDPELVRPHTSVYVQEGAKILDSIRDELAGERNDPRLVSIREKLREIERAGGEENNNTISLFQVMTGEEREYMRERGCIQSGRTGDFAVTFPCYRRIRDGAM